MEVNDNYKKSNSDYNKEKKYREEIFKLLKDVINYESDTENDLFYKLFNENSLDNEQFLELIKKI
jgi:hypothetical protein